MRLTGLDLCLLMIAKFTVNELCIFYSGFMYFDYRMRLISAISKKMNAIMYAINGKYFSPLCWLEKLFFAVAWSAVFSSRAVQQLVSGLAVNAPCASMGGISCSYLVCSVHVCSN